MNTKLYLLTNRFGKTYYDIESIIRVYELPIRVRYETTILVELTESEKLDLEQSYPDLGIFEHNPEPIV